MMLLANAQNGLDSQQTVVHLLVKDTGRRVEHEGRNENVLSACP